MAVTLGDSGTWVGVGGIAAAGLSMYAETSSAAAVSGGVVEFPSSEEILVNLLVRD